MIEYRMFSKNRKGGRKFEPVQNRGGQLVLYKTVFIDKQIQFIHDNLFIQC